jgi:ubiquitin carboxyl-terminal hydrolase 9/13
VVAYSQTPSASAAQPLVKKDPNAPVPTALEKLLAPDALDPVRQDGSDKYFGFENVSEHVITHVR